MDLQLADKVYVITGGARGLGRATAEALVAEGAKVVVSSRHQDMVDAAVAELGDRAVGVAADNADPGTPARLLEAARAFGDSVHGVLVSVGGPVVGETIDITDEQWSAAFESVFLGAVRIAREFAAVLPAGGSITFVLSSSVRSPIPGLAVSNGLRPGLAMVAKTLSDELGPRGIRVNGLMPGRIDTERVRELDALSGDSVTARAKAEATIPLQRYGRPEEFGATAAFLMSPVAGFVTGVMLPVDGGMLRTI